MATFYSFFLLIISCACAVPLSDNANDNILRISNGVAAAENQFPYMVSLQSTVGAAQQQPTRGHICGGVLITLQHVLTTATCLSQVVNGATNWIPANQMQVFGGSVLLENSGPNFVRAIANYTVHPDYHSAPSYLNDIAILTLIEPFPAAAALSPLQLPPADHEPQDFQLCSVAGWGATQANDNTASTVMRFANKYIYNQNLCTSVYSTKPGVSNVFPSMVCAASFDIISTGCAGDNGNALVCNNTLTGILFHHNDCIPTSFPELYTRVSNYTTWIRSITGSASTFTPGIFMLSLITVSQFVFVKVVS